MISSRDLILQRIRARLHGAVIHDDTIDPQPTSVLPAPSLEVLRQRFMDKASALGSMVHLVPTRDAVPTILENLLQELELPLQAVCWPALAPWLDQHHTRLNLFFRPAEPADAVGVTGCHCAIADTGTLVLRTSALTPGSVSLLPETHVALVSEEDLVSDMKASWRHLAREPWARSVNFVSGPSRTADIEQTVVIGAHGPARVIILLYGSAP